MVTVQNPVKRICQQCQIDRLEFARRSGISYSTASMIAKNGVQNLHDATAQKIAAFAGEDPEKIKEEFRQCAESQITRG